MKRIVWDKPAVRSFKRLLKRNPGLTEAIKEALSRPADDPFHPSLQTHKLKGKLGSRSARYGRRYPGGYGDAGLLGAGTAGQSNSA